MKANKVSVKIFIPLPVEGGSWIINPEFFPSGGKYATVYQRKLKDGRYRYYFLSEAGLIKRLWLNSPGS